jgi:hypothetical protein
VGKNWTGFGAVLQKIHMGVALRLDCACSTK